MCIKQKPFHRVAFCASHRLLGNLLNLYEVFYPLEIQSHKSPTISACLLSIITMHNYKSEWPNQGPLTGSIWIQKTIIRSNPIVSCWYLFLVFIFGFMLVSCWYLFFRGPHEFLELCSVTATCQSTLSFRAISTDCFHFFTCREAARSCRSVGRKKNNK